MVEIIYSSFITLRNGKKLYAWEKGLKVFRFIAKNKITKDPSKDEPIVKNI